MIKILILFAIVILSAVFGLVLSNEKKTKVKVFEQFCDFNEKLIINLKYGREKVSKIAEDYGFVKKCLSGEKVLSGDEGKFLSEYLSSIGQTDAASQIDYLNERKIELENYRRSSRDNYKKYGSLYFKLCLMAGILIAVLFA